MCHFCFCLISSCHKNAVSEYQWFSGSYAAVYLKTSGIYLRKTHHKSLLWTVTKPLYFPLEFAHTISLSMPCALMFAAPILEMERWSSSVKPVNITVSLSGHWLQDINSSERHSQEGDAETRQKQKLNLNHKISCNATNRRKWSYFFPSLNRQTHWSLQWKSLWWGLYKKIQFKKDILPRNWPNSSLY